MLKEYITEKDYRTLNQEFRQNLDSYKSKAEDVTDESWIKQLILRRCPGVSEEDAAREAGELISSLNRFNDNLKSMEKANSEGVSKEKWLADKLQESAIGMSAEQYNATLRNLDDALYQQNQELAEALSRSSDGHIMMSPNLDGNIAEHMVARTSELMGKLQNKNISVDVRAVNTPNSVDVRATNLDTGSYQNYQLKFGEDAKATIRLIERGNYNNQRIIVPSEQLEEVREHFRLKGSEKSITDHIEIAGVKGRSFTKAEMKQLQQRAQEEGIMPTLDDYYYSTKEYAMSIGKNAGVMALQMAAVTTGINVVSKICQGQEIKADEVVEDALKTGADTGVKVVAAGTLHTAAKRGMLSFLPKGLQNSHIAGIAFAGVENAKVLLKMATGKLSTVKGLDQMGRITVSMAGGLWAMGLVKGALAGAALGGPVGVGVGLVTGMVGYAAGSGIGNQIYSGVKKVASVAKEAGKRAFEGLKRGAEMVRSVAKKIPVIGWFF